MARKKFLAAAQHSSWRLRLTQATLQSVHLQVRCPSTRGRGFDMNWWSDVLHATQTHSSSDIASPDPGSLAQGPRGRCAKNLADYNNNWFLGQQVISMDANSFFLPCLISSMPHPEVPLGMILKEPSLHGAIQNFQKWDRNVLRLGCLVEELLVTYGRWVLEFLKCH